MTFFYSQGKIRMALFGIHILSIFPFQLSQMILAVGRYPLCKVYSTFLRNNNSIGTWKRMPPHFLVFSLGMVCLPGRYFFFLVESRTFSVLDSFKSLRAVRRRWRRYWEEPTNAHAAVVTLLYEWMGPVQSAARSFSPAGRFYFDAGRSYFQPPLHQQRRPNVKWNFAMDKHAAGNKSRTGSDSPENISEKKKPYLGSVDGLLRAMEVSLSLIGRAFQRKCWWGLIEFSCMFYALKKHIKMESLESWGNSKVIRRKYSMVLGNLHEFRKKKRTRCCCASATPKSISGSKKKPWKRIKTVFL